MTTTEMLPECRGGFEFLDLILTGGRQLWKCGNDTIFKPILKNVTSLPVAICLTAFPLHYGIILASVLQIDAATHYVLKRGRETV